MGSVYGWPPRQDKLLQRDQEDRAGEFAHCVLSPSWVIEITCKSNEGLFFVHKLRCIDLEQRAGVVGFPRDRRPTRLAIAAC